MINYYKLKLEVGETKVTDFNEGSEIRNLLEAFAVAIYALLEEQHESTKIAFIQTSYGEWLDKLGAMPFINLPRTTGDVAKGTVKFTLATTQTSNYTIPSETILLSTDTGLNFVTVGDCIISTGETTGEVYCEALAEGSDGNIPSGSIDTIDDLDVDTELVSVTNLEAFDGGFDYEDDESYRQRLLDFVQSEGFGTVAYYKSLGEGVSGVHDVKLVADASYTRKVYVNGRVKPTPDSVILDTMAEYTNLDNIVVGHSFICSKPSYTTVPLSITLSVATELDEDELETMLQRLFDGGGFRGIDFDGLNIDESLTRDRIVSAFMTFADVVDVTSITSNSTEITTVSPSSNGVLKLGTVSFTQNEV